MYVGLIIIQYGIVTFSSKISVITAKNLLIFLRKITVEMTVELIENILIKLKM